MKRFSVKVNGQVYEVEVTELKSGESAPAVAYTAPAYSHAAPAPAAAAPLATGIVHPQPTTYKAPAVKHHSAAVERIMKQAAAGKSEPEAPIAPGGFVVKAPMPGKITFMSAKEGAKVKKGDELMVLEAMKMGNSITAPVSGVIKSVNVKEGDTVLGKQTLLVIGE